MSELEKYASIVWEPEDLIELRPLQPWQGLRTWVKMADLPEHLERMQAENERGANIFAGILPRNKDGGGTAEDVDGGRVIWADFDHCEAEAAIEITGKLNMPIPSMVVATGHGAHLFWRLKEWTEKPIIQELVSGLISYFLEQAESRPHIDKSAKDPARILRLPGFVNHKPPAAKARIIYADQELRYTPEDFAKYIPQAPETQQHTPIPTGSNKIERARRYLAMIPGCAPGGRTNTAFRAACVMVNDIGLTEAEALPLLEGWDAGANSPTITQDYGQEELRKIINNAQKYCKKPAGCLNTPNPQKKIFSGGNLSDVYFPKPEEKIEAFPEQFLNVPGFIGDVMKFNLDTAPKPQPVLALAGAIVLQAVLCARKLTDEYGTRPNIYICGIAPSGAGKDHARQLNKRILFEAELGKLHGEDVASGSGLLNSLLLQPAQLFQIDEFGRFIKAITSGRNDHLAQVLTYLMNLYSESGGIKELPKKAADEGSRIIQYPHAILYGTTVPKSFYDAMTEENITEGSLSRILLFDVDGNHPKRKRIQTLTMPEGIIERAKWWGNFKPGGGNLEPYFEYPHVVPVSDAARAIADAFIDKEYEHINKMKGNPISTIWTRTAQNADKLALIYAASKAPESPVIDEEAALWGYGLAEWLTRRMCSLFDGNVAENDFHANCLKVKKILKENGGKMTREKLIQRIRKLKARELDEIIATLIEANEIKVSVMETQGRPRVEYTLNV